jgi:hypothetical protein
MKTSRFKKLAWVFFALVLTTTSVSAQGFGHRNRIPQSIDGKPCIEKISDLTEKQKTEILAIRQKHQEEMVALREDRPSTIDFDKKDGIREKMLEQKVDHRNAVKALLNPDQQRQYDMILAGGGKLQYCNNSYWVAYGNQGFGFRQDTGNRSNCLYAVNIKGKGKGKANNSGKNGRGFRFNHSGRCCQN